MDEDQNVLVKLMKKSLVWDWVRGTWMQYDPNLNNMRDATCEAETVSASQRIREKQDRIFGKKE